MTITRNLAPGEPENQWFESLRARSADGVPCASTLYSSYRSFRNLDTCIAPEISLLRVRNSLAGSPRRHCDFTAEACIGRVALRSSIRFDPQERQRRAMPRLSQPAPPRQAAD